MSDSTDRLWDGRFTEATDAFVEAFTASVSFDQVLAIFDIEGSIAHATMLGRCSIIPADTAKAIIEGLEGIREDIKAGNFTWSEQLEDVHMNIEAELTHRIGEQGKALHTGRSRNDQVATDVRMYLRFHIDQILDQIRHLQQGLINLASQHTHTIMPGFTHLQVAQPVVFGHHLMAWYEMLCRDEARLQDCRRRVNILPLGAAALAGTSFPIDRNLVADLLGFDDIADNSLDAVSDRDFAIEFSAAASLLMMHLSRWSEELILWASPQFDFIALPDRFCTGSSIMPQKKNPDVPELVRGKAARVFGGLMTLLTLMKGQPLAYNKDNQEDKEPLIDTIRTVENTLTAFGDMIPNIEAKPQAMRLAAAKGFATATDLADYLVRQGMPFRDAHHIVGRLVGLAESRNLDLSELKLSDFHQESDQIKEDVYQILTLEGSVAARAHPGGTAPKAVQAAIERAQKRFR
ncbi:MAG: argininosuccinate lyase [Proteobacteria bacterium]|nr:argininosuccinate lyase [Pseudomonadota bacterium]MDA1206135.1 argininosuccinate lyase [Pseudomonadota bacterium]